ncbi:MAG: hypothetical protein ABSG91_15065 [Syntrophobacteraceae bacterium]|jgi:hypothetical protein
MRVSKTIFIELLIVAVSLFMSESLLADTVYLLGKIGDFSIGASLERNEEELAGWYFYHSRAKEIRLEGRIDLNGTFRMDEMTEGRKTGIFEGSVKQGRWTGIWRKTIAGAPLPFYLEENRNQLKNLRADYTCTVKERVAEHHYTYRWKLKLSVADGVVKELDSTQGAYGDDKDEQTCTIALSDLKQIASESGILLQAKDDNSGEEDKKCTVRIVGDTDILWIRFGDSSEEGNDCRSAGSNMFCSPRAFWNDIIVDRRTQKCRALK